MTAESANLNTDGAVECHFSLEEFSVPPLTPTVKRTSWCHDVHLFQLISHRIWQARQMGISVELSAEYLVHAKAYHKHGSLSGSDESTYSENCSMPWPLTGTMRNPDLLSPTFLHTPNILPSDFSHSPKLPPWPKNNQTLTFPSPPWHFRINFVIFLQTFRRCFGSAPSWFVLHLLARCRKCPEFSCLSYPEVGGNVFFRNVCEFIATLTTSNPGET